MCVPVTKWLGYEMMLGRFPRIPINCTLALTQSLTCSCISCITLKHVLSTKGLNSCYHKTVHKWSRNTGQIGITCRLILLCRLRKVVTELSFLTISFMCVTIKLYLDRKKVLNTEGLAFSGESTLKTVSRAQQTVFFTLNVTYVINNMISFEMLSFKNPAVKHIDTRLMKVVLLHLPQYNVVCWKLIWGHCWTI